MSDRFARSRLACSCLARVASLTGMGVPKGVTLIVGGGFHGKSTLLEALQLGVYEKVRGARRHEGRRGHLSQGHRGRLSHSLSQPEPARITAVACARVTVAA